MSPVTVNWTALTHVIGWTLVHFVWQGILLAAALGLIRLLIPQPFVRVRYAAGCITLAAMLAVPLLTATQIAGGWANAPAPSVATTDAEHLASVRSNVSAVVERTAVPFGSPARDRVLPLLVIAWGIGVLVCATRLAGGWWHARRLVLAGTQPAPESLVASSRAIARRMGLARAVRLFVSTRVQVPLVVGWLRPVLLVPAAVVAGLPVHQLEAVLAHELAHVRRHDYLVNLLQAVVETLLFYHPAVWWVSHTIRVEREHCCDDLAVAACGDRIAYARALAAVESFRHDRVALALAVSGGSLVARIRRLLGAAPPRHVSTSHWVVAALTALMVSGAGATSLVDDLTGLWPSNAFAQQPGRAAPPAVEGSSAAGQPTPSPAPSPAGPGPGGDTSRRVVQPPAATGGVTSEEERERERALAQAEAEAEAARREAMAHARKAIEEAHRAAEAAMKEYRRALEEAHRARAEAMEQYRLALQQARRATAEARAKMRAEYASRPEIQELVRQTRKLAREAQLNAEKIAREARRAARRAVIEAQRERRRSSDGPGPVPVPAPPDVEVPPVPVVPQGLAVPPVPQVPPAPEVAPGVPAPPAPVVPPAAVPPAPVVPPGSAVPPAPPAPPVAVPDVPDAAPPAPLPPPDGRQPPQA